jgi:hypothetical protein
MHTLQSGQCTALSRQKGAYWSEPRLYKYNKRKNIQENGNKRTFGWLMHSFIESLKGNKRDMMET